MPRSSDAVNRPANWPIAEVATERMATGGEAVGHLDDGRVVFVAGALPGERVRIEIDRQKKRFAKARVIEVLEASTDRRDQSCSHAAAGHCGGCDWLHIDPAQQREYKVAIAREQLQRLGGIAQPSVGHHVDAPGLRTTVRCVVTDGRAGYRQRRSHSSFDAQSCDAAHPLLRPLIIEGRYPGAEEVTLRASVATGERLVIVTPSRSGAESTLDSIAGDVVVVDRDDPGDAAIVEEIAGVSFRISALSFFQTSPEGAATLVSVIRDALADTEGPVADLYGGVGLLGAAGFAERLHTLVESSPSAVADASHNLARLGVGGDVEVVRDRVERWKPTTRFGAVIADPARAGLRPEGVQVIGATEAPELVLVSCDAGALGRDAGLLVDDGWAHVDSLVVDMFPDTSQLEVVSHFRRATG